MVSNKRMLKHWRAPSRNEIGEKRCAGRKLNVDGCLLVIGKNRYTWCSQECYDFCSFQTHPGFARYVILERDNGICADCGMDTEKLRRVISYANQSYMSHRKGFKGLLQYGYRRTWVWAGCNDVLMGMGFRLEQSLWQLDHMIELRDGGSHLPENCQTLCVMCHTAKTKMNVQLRAAWKRKERERGKDT